MNPPRRNAVRTANRSGTRDFAGHKSASALSMLERRDTHISPTSAVVELGLNMMPPLPTSIGMVFAVTAAARAKTERMGENMLLLLLLLVVCSGAGE